LLHLNATSNHYSAKLSWHKSGVKNKW